ncbi:MAG: ParB N-terminal domain-containing protein, partial [Methylobacterium sp.]|nr:ParB N-terminal domain-containing protein [Methylobacterium sp.]
MPEQRTIDIPSIVIKPNRQRQEYEPNAMEELRSSIEERGLIHAPVLRRDGNSLVLVAGERRLRAIKDLFALGAGFSYDGRRFEAADNRIPYTDLGELSPLAAEEAELDENLRRKDLTWQEHAAAVARLHKLREDQLRQEFIDECEAENAVQRERAKVAAPQQTIAATALEVTGQDTPYARETIRQELVVAKHLNNPLIANAKTANEAFKLLKREEERKQHLAMAATIGASLSSGDHKLLLGDCLQHMQSMTGQFDLIITDPPYGMDAQNFRDG